VKNQYIRDYILPEVFEFSSDNQPEVDEEEEEMNEGARLIGR